jgi:hypothetical protein
MQPWRWQWLGTVAAALLLPQIVFANWQGKSTGRATALLLIAAWIFASNEYALAASGAALASLAFTHRLRAGEARLILFGSLGMLAIAITWRIATNLEFTDSHYLDSSIPWWIRRAMSFTRDGTAPLVAIAAAWWLMHTRGGRPALVVLTVLAATLCAALAPQTWRSWAAREFPPQLRADFAGFRSHISPGAEIFWPESPVAVWMLLDRPSYLSVIQSSGMVFSRETALEFDRRAHALRGAISPAAFLGWNTAATGMNLSSQQLQAACETREFEYLVTPVDLGVEPVASVPSASGPASKKIRLYRCRA